MNIAILGSGGRESALAWAVSKSPRCKNLYILPGNGGTTKYGRNVPIELKPPFKDLIEFVKLANIDLVIVGPEEPLVYGVVDILEKEKIKVFGPSFKASRLEGSKAYLKDFLHRYSIPTAKFAIFNHPEDAFNFVEKAGRPFVVKTDGLAAGKGAIVCKTVEETLLAIKRVMVNKEFGSAGDKIVIEDILSGIEVSVFVVTDGKNYKWLAVAQDHKRVFDNDEGPNTGGMGAFAPVPFLNEQTRHIIEENIIKPTIKGMERDGAPYKGILYFGLMLTSSGPAVIEYNIRFGDPEAEAVLPLLKTDFVEIVLATLSGKLNELKIDFYPGYCNCVVLVSGGYPGNYKKGYEISGDIEDRKDSIVFHAGTIYDEGKFYTAGGRVLCVSALGSTLEEAIKKSYERVAKIQFKDMHYRRDIGQKGLNFKGGI
ncbi:MAG: phosphoribosylamine--glycine ligase [Brevinematales bacterium]|nr:phosphoribosylamine--glycine ligase [Brevinematales bacterium]